MNDFCVITTLVVKTVIYYIAGFRQICFLFVYKNGFHYCLMFNYSMN